MAESRHGSKYTTAQKNFLKSSLNMSSRLNKLPFYIKIVITSILVIVTFILHLYLASNSSEGKYILFIGTIMVSTWFFGALAGSYATFFSAILIDYYLIPPYNSFRFSRPGSLLLFMFFTTLGFIISRLMSTMQKALIDSENSRHTIIKNEKQFRLMVEGISDYAIYFLNPEGFVINWNEGAQQIKGYKKEEVIGKHFSMFYTREETAERKPWKELEIAKQNGKYEDETWRVKKDGSKFWGHYTLNAIVDDEGRLEGFVTIVQDTTQRRLLEQQKDNFISIASHELKTPITSIKAFTQLMQKKFQKLDDKQSLYYLNRMDMQLNKLTGLIEDLLDVSRITQGRIEYSEDVFKFDELVNDVIEEIQLIAPGHKIVKHGHADELVLADKYRIGQVLTNLLTNAIKYSPKADKISVKTSVTPEGVLVAVKDYGIGIPKDQQPHIFERFYRAHGNNRESYPGLGLGLFISSEIMKRHGGKMWFESTPGKGTTFYFLLPITLREKLLRHDLAQKG